MKKFLLMIIVAFTFSGNIIAQEVSVGADVVSNYIWRGVKFGGPSVQPTVELGFGDLAIGSWGSFALSAFDVPMENDFYASYSMGDLSVGVTDYYYQGPLFETSTDSGSHALEINVGYAVDAVSISANYIVNEAGGAGSAGSDMYFELGYALENISLFVGAGDGWHSSDGEFALVNVGISVSKEVKVTEDLSLPVFGSIIVNPDAELSYLFVGFSL